MRRGETKHHVLKERKKELKAQEDKIKLQWKTRWENEMYSSAGCDDKYFADWLLANLEFLESGIEWNRSKNFWMKGIALISFIGTYVVAFCLAYKLDKLDLLDTVVLLIPTYAIYKWIGVKKYQETWSRYTGYRFGIMMEMSKYLYGIAPYGSSDDKEKFIENIIGLSRSNVKKFQNNMETKEEKILQNTLNLNAKG